MHCEKNFMLFSIITSKLFYTVRMYTVMLLTNNPKQLKKINSAVNSFFKSKLGSQTSLFRNVCWKLLWFKDSVEISYRKDGASKAETQWKGVKAKRREKYQCYIWLVVTWRVFYLHWIESLASFWWTSKKSWINLYEHVC